MTDNKFIFIFCWNWIISLSLNYLKEEKMKQNKIEYFLWSTVFLFD